MPRPKPSAFTGSADVDAMVERVAPDILELLADGVPRRKPASVAALANRHAEDEIELTLIRLAVTEQVRETGGQVHVAGAQGGNIVSRTCSPGRPRLLSRPCWRLLLLIRLAGTGAAGPCRQRCCRRRCWHYRGPGAATPWPIRQQRR